MIFSKISRIVNGEITKLKNHSKNRDSNVWLFGEWFGQRCCDNCMYLANYIAQNHPEIHVYWASEEGTDLSALDRGIDRIVFGSEEAMAVYKTAAAVFMNQDLRDFSKEGANYFSGALVVNLWHGVMWKHIGHDGSKASGGLYALYSKVLDSIYGADVFTAVSEEYARNCKTAFGAGSDRMIRAGSPRNIIFFRPEMVRAAREKVLEVLSAETGLEWSNDTRIITYMPTFRDTVENSFSFEDMADDSAFMKWLDENNAVILQKAHFVTKQRNEIKSEPGHKRIYPFNDVSAQVLLAATDLLVTDYSSCFFDYLLLDRPIVHYLYDYDFYLNHDRGMYYEKEEVVCGDVAVDKDELAEMIIRNIQEPMKEHDLRAARRQRFMTYEAPDSCETICKEIKKRLAVM